MIKMLQQKLRQWVLRGPPLPIPSSAVESRLQTLMGSRPTMLAWQIDNGFVVVRHDDLRDQMRIHFCADHQAIADYLISSAAQQSLFPSEKAISGETIRTMHTTQNAKATPSYRPGVI